LRFNGTVLFIETFALDTKSMIEFFSKLFDTSDFPPRWRCGIWDDAHGWLHILSDLAIFGAYTAIPLVIAFFVIRKKQDIPFPRILWLFVIFIFACGTTHLIEAIIFWQPIYRFAGIVKLLTATASWATVAALFWITPEALKLPGLATLNNELAGEIEERKRTEQALRESEERLRLALAAGRMGTWEWEIPSGEVRWSPELEKLHGRAIGSFPGRFEAMFEDVAPEDREWVRTCIERAVKNDEEHQVEYRIKLAEGKMRWVEGRGRVFRNTDGSAQRMMGICADITDRKRADLERESLLLSEREARSAAEQANRMTDEFLSVVSHELRTPLSAILGYAQLLQMDMVEPDEMSEAIDAIERNSQAQVRIIDDLLDMSRIVSGKLRIHPVSLHPHQAVEAALETIRPAAEAKGVQLTQSIDVTAGPVFGDFDRLQQIVWNLVSNAVKFTPQGGRVDVSLARVDSQVEIAIADTGNGISAEFLPHVFERYRQWEESTTRRHGGLGLGLAIVRQLVELHGGSVRASSEGENRGATFTVRLPIHEAIAGSTEPTRTAVATNGDAGGRLPDLHGISVLVVDDELDTGDVVRRILEHRGAKVTTAGCGQDALDLLDSVNPDVIVSDIGMPGMDGYQLIREIRGRSTSDGGSVSAVALTAFARSEDRKRALMAGFQSHVTKPVDQGELLAVIAMLTRRT
jgi:PAS domain S-box-containing protein